MDLRVCTKPPANSEAIGGAHHVFSRIPASGSAKQAIWHMKFRVMVCFLNLITGGTHHVCVNDMADQSDVYHIENPAARTE